MFAISGFFCNVRDVDDDDGGWIVLSIAAARVRRLGDWVLLNTVCVQTTGRANSLYKTHGHRTMIVICMTRFYRNVPPSPAPLWRAKTIILSYEQKKVETSKSLGLKYKIAQFAILIKTPLSSAGKKIIIFNIIGSGTPTMYSNFQTNSSTTISRIFNPLMTPRSAYFNSISYELLYAIVLYFRSVSYYLSLEYYFRIFAILNRGGAATQ